MPKPDLAPAGAAPLPRDPRLDVFRGVALVMIFINHVPGTVFEHLTSRNFGTSDAAEGFVLMSGVAAGLAYGPAFRKGPYWPGVARVWNRVWTLYLVHLMMVAWALGIAAAAALWLGGTHRLYVNEMNILFEAPLGFLVGIPLLTHQLGYVNILPMYAVLLTLSPVALWLALRRPALLLVLSGLLWLVTGLREWNLPNYPNPGGWFFNPLAWQILFTVGLVTGVLARDGRRLVPVTRRLQWLAGGVLFAGLIWVRVPSLGLQLDHALWQANQTWLPRFFAFADKTYETWPRLVHILALAYLLSSLPVVRQAAASPLAMPLAVMGRNALPVFAFGSLLSLVAQAVKDVAPQGLAVDMVLILGGLGLQFMLALGKDRLTRKPGRSAPIPALDRAMNSAVLQ